jgi:Fe-S cluster assembly iron-binding protein IscA
VKAVLQHTVPRGHSLLITAAAAAELSRQAAVAGTPGLMHLDLLDGSCERWAIRLRPGHLAGTPIARADGITLHAPTEQAPMLAGLQLDYKGDLSGGGFLVRATDGIVTCPCGAAFSRAPGRGTTTQ